MTSTLPQHHPLAFKYEYRSDFMGVERPSAETSTGHPLPLDPSSPSTFSSQVSAGRYTTPRSAQLPQATSTNPRSADKGDNVYENIFRSTILVPGTTRQSFLATVLGPSDPSKILSSSGPSSQLNHGSAEGRRPECHEWQDKLPSCYNNHREHLPDPIDLNLLTEAESVDLLNR